MLPPSPTQAASSEECPDQGVEFRAGLEVSAPPGLPPHQAAKVVPLEASALEGDECAEQDEFRDLDIAGEILRVASEGLSSVDNVIQQAESLRYYLAFAEETFFVLRITLAY